MSTRSPEIRKLCIQYNLPSPLSLLTDEPTTKESFKRLVKSKVLDWWENKLHQDVNKLSSLNFFRSNYYSLKTPHPIYSSCPSSIYETNKAIVQEKMLSGRYRSCWLERHWSANNPGGSCSLPICRLNPTPGTLSHILTECKDLDPARQRVLILWSDYLQDYPTIQSVIEKYCFNSEPELFVQFLLDCTVLPEVIVLCQSEGKHVYDTLFYLTRTFCFSVHKLRLKILGKWNVK